MRPECSSAAAQPPFRGSGAVTAEVEGTGLSPVALIGSLKGSGKVVLTDGQIAGLDPRTFNAVIRAVDQGGVPIERRPHFRTGGEIAGERAIVFETRRGRHARGRGPASDRQGYGGQRGWRPFGGKHARPDRRYAGCATDANGAGHRRRRAAGDFRVAKGPVKHASAQRRCVGAHGLADIAGC